MGLLKRWAISPISGEKALDRWTGILCNGVFVEVVRGQGSARQGRRWATRGSRALKGLHLGASWAFLADICERSSQAAPDGSSSVSHNIGGGDGGDGRSICR